ncbi:MAG: alpha/beta hydrolase family protein [Gammaproteobacteria bacterium]
MESNVEQGLPNDMPAHNEATPIGRGPYPVGSTNMEIATSFARDDQVMHELLLGRGNSSVEHRFVSDVLEHPKSVWVNAVQVPDRTELYGSASGSSLPVVTFLTYPSSVGHTKNPYAFPYHDSAYGIFEDMLNDGEAPEFADSDERYPLILIVHGFSAHGIYDIQHAHDLASHGYIVAVVNYGDNRTLDEANPVRYAAFLRPFLTKEVIDSILQSDTFGPHIDTDNIGLTGHSLGGYAGLALAGARHQGNPASVTDKRIKANVIAAPWVGNVEHGLDVFAFDHSNSELRKVTTPTLCLFGTNDTDTPASLILPAMKQLSGPTYVVELVGQPHVFEAASWKDRNGWELLFFSAYLKGDASSLAKLKALRSMTGGNENTQLLDYQK